MKKFTLCLSLLLAGASAAFAVAPNAMPEVSTSRDNAKLYAISSYRGNVGDKTAAVLASAGAENKATTATGTIDENSMWYVLAGPEDGTYYICNYGAWDADYPDEDPALGVGAVLGFNPEDGGAPYYILPNGVNELGLVLSTSADITSGSTCLDKFNAGVGLSGGWHPSETDWEGTTWSFVPVDLDATPEENWATVSNAWIELHAGPIKSAALASIDNLIGSNPWTVADFDAAKEAINALESPTQAQVDEIIAGAIDAATNTLNQSIVGKTFSFQGVRNIAMAATGNYHDVCTYIGVGEVLDADSATVSGLVPVYEAYSYAVWTAVQTEGGFKLQNTGTKEYVATLPASWSQQITATENADEAAVFTAGFFSGTNSGVTFYTVTPATEESDEVRMALNVSGVGLNGTYGTKVVSYMPNDNGSTFKIELVDLSGINGVEIENANGPVEFYNIQGVRVNPETAGPGLYIRRQGNKAVKVLVR